MRPSLYRSIGTFPVSARVSVMSWGRPLWRLTSSVDSRVIPFWSPRESHPAAHFLLPHLTGQTCGLFNPRQVGQISQVRGSH